MLENQEFIFSVNETNKIIIGLFCIICAFFWIFIAKKYDKNPIIILSLSCMITGKTLFTIGLYYFITKYLDISACDHYENYNYSLLWIISSIGLIITLSTYYIYRISIEQFLSSYVTLLTLFLFMPHYTKDPNLQEIIINILFLINICGVALLFLYNKTKKKYIPLAYAFACSLCSYCLLLLLPTKHDLLFLLPTFEINILFINLELTILLISLIIWIARGINKIKNTPIILLLGGVVSLGILSEPSILIFIILMTIGYTKHEKLLRVIGVFFMPIFLFLYYYNLNLSLSKKSGILIISGIILLAGYIYIKYNIKNNEALVCKKK